MISESSVVSAVAFYSVMLILVGVVRRVTPFLKIGGGDVLLWAMYIAAIRLALPFEIPITYVIRSENVLAVPKRYLRENPDTTHVLTVIWAAGAVFFIAWAFLSLGLAYRRCREYHIEKDESERVRKIAERCKVKCPVWVSRDVKVPYVAGIIHPVIYLPAFKLPDREIELILAHENQHIRSHDAWIKLIFGLIRAVLWWNPVVHIFRREIDALLELRCDRRVTEDLSKKEKTEYLDMLTDLAARVAKRRVPALALNESSALGLKPLVRQRFEAVDKRKDNVARRVCTAAKLVLPVLLVASYFVILVPTTPPVEEKFEAEDGVNYHENYNGPEVGDDTSNTFLLKGSDGRYQLCVNYKFVRYLSEEEIASGEYEGLFVFGEDRER